MTVVKVKVKIKEGDEVIVIAGKDKNKQGSVRKVRHCKNGRVKVLVDGVSMVKKHVKANPQANKPGGIIEQESFIDISNVMLFNTTTQKADRVGYRLLNDGRKVRYFKSTGDVVDVEKV